MNKMQGLKNSQKNRWGEQRATLRHSNCPALRSMCRRWKVTGWIENVGCVSARPWCVRQCLNFSRDINSTVGRLVTLPTQTDAWTRAKAPACWSAKTLLSVLALLFPLPPVPLSAPTLHSFVLSPSSPRFSPLSRLFLLIFSHLPPPAPLPLLLSAISCSTRLPRQEGLVSHVCPPGEIRRSKQLSSV